MGFLAVTYIRTLNETYNLLVTANVISSKATDTNTSSIVVHIVPNIDEKTFH